MATFSQWAKHRRVSRLMWVCGPEPVLREEVVAAARQAAGEVLTLQASELPEADVWAAAAQFPVDPDVPRLVLVRDAQRLRRWDGFPALASAKELGSLMFVTDEADFPRRDGAVAPHVARIKNSSLGQAVVCKAPAADALLDWLAARLPSGGRVLASSILAEVTDAGDHTDLDAAAAAAAKMTVTGQLTPAAARAVTEEPGGDFADALVLRGVKAALATAPGAGHAETGAAIGKLGWTLGVLALLNEAAGRKLGAREVNLTYGIREFLFVRFRGVAAAYSPRRVTQCQEVLAMADGHWRAGADGGILEAIALSW